MKKIMIGKVALLLSTAMLYACGSQETQAPEDQAKNADDLLVVDCLLPGQVRKLGKQATFLTARRPIKTTVADCEIRGGEYVSYDRADYTTALKVWLPMAESGDAEAQNYVGEIYEKGLGAQPDYATAVYWYQKAADQGLNRAMINLGQMYENGNGVIRDPARALTLYRKASGIQGDEIHYASTIQVAKASQDELAALQAKVKKQEKQINFYRGQLADAKSQLAKEEIKTKSLRESYAVVASQLAEAKDPEKIKALQAELDKSEAELQAQKDLIENLQFQVSGYHRNLNDLIKENSATDLPVIEIIDPPIVVTRNNKPGVILSKPASVKEVIGKISAKAGIKALKVNGQVAQIDEYNLFWLDVPLAEDETVVQIEATDKNNRVTRFDFSIYAAQQQSDAQEEAIAEQPYFNPDINLGQYYALVIGNNAYTEISPLETAEADAKTVEELLRKQYGFKTTLLLNANRYDMLSAFNTLREKLTEQDNLLIYYAGHGELDKANNRGYWLPVDANTTNTANWVSNVTISDILNTIPAKHIMVVADSCYSGTMSASSVARMDVEVDPAMQAEWIEVMSMARARTVLSSGGVRPVIDSSTGGEHSIFAEAFIEVLQNNQNLVEANLIYRQVLGKVRKKALEMQQDQVPEYAPIQHAGHEAGEFFFKPVKG